MNPIVLLQSLLINLLMPLQAVANSDDDLAALMSFLTPMTTLSGDFRQQTLDARQQSLQVVTGQFVMMREGPQLLWQTDAPDDQILRVREGTLWSLDLGLEQLVIQDLGQMLAQSPALLLTGSQQEIARQYEVELLAESANDAVFALIPRDPSSTLERIEMRFVAGQPERLRLLDSFQQTTLVVFQNLQMNLPSGDLDFEFEIPADFDVIDQRSP